MLFDFKCQACSHLFERNVSSSVREQDCPECNATAKRQISVPHFSLPITSDWPGSAHKWERVHEKGSKKYE